MKKYIIPSALIGAVSIAIAVSTGIAATVTSGLVDVVSSACGKCKACKDDGKDKTAE